MSTTCLGETIIFHIFANLKYNKKKEMMRKILMAIMMVLPILSSAQNTWEMPEHEEGIKENPDQKYLAGAVPVVDGRVTFEKTIEAPGKSAEQTYQIMRRYMLAMTQEENQLEKSRIAIDDSINHKLCGTYQEWLVFKSTALSLDRTRFTYNIFADCHDGKVAVKLTRIYYLYEEERNPQTYKAEEWITDEYGLRKNKDKLARITGKFRRKTIDRKDYLFNKFTHLLNR